MKRGRAEKEAILSATRQRHERRDHHLGALHINHYIYIIAAVIRIFGTLVWSGLEF
jgi:hypothetical protein